MKRYLAIFGFVFIGVIAGLIVRGIPIVLQVQAGGGIPQADRNGDVNGDARLDMSDAVYLLLHIFRDGPQPVAFAQAEPADLGGLEGSLGSIADSLAYESLKNRHDRFVEHGNGTVTDRLTGLMWRQVGEDAGNWPESMNNAEASTHAGYENWRLPTAMELQSIFTMGKEAAGAPTGDFLIYPVFEPNAFPFWSSTKIEGRSEVWCFTFHYEPHGVATNIDSVQYAPFQRRQKTRYPAGDRGILSYLVRDITPRSNQGRACSPTRSTRPSGRRYWEV